MDTSNNIVMQKSFDFSLRIVRLRKYLSQEAPVKELDISRQLLRSGTSIGANIEVAQGAQSSSDFLSKMSIAYKEARESRYWIRLLAGADYISAAAEESLLNDIEELCKLLGSIIVATKETIRLNESKK